MLVARSHDKLLATAAELGRDQPERTFKCVVADFASSVESGVYAAIGKELVGLQIAVLVNNVGESQLWRSFVAGRPRGASPACDMPTHATLVPSSIHTRTRELLSPRAGVSYPGALFFHEVRLPHQTQG